MAFKMKGHSLPGIKQKFEDTSIINAAPKKYKTKNGVEGFEDTTMEDGRAASSAFQMKASPFKGWGEAVAYQESIQGPTMDELVAQRKGLEHDKTSLEYRQLQDKINLAYAGGVEGKYRKLVTPEEEVVEETEEVATMTDPNLGIHGPELPPEETMTEEELTSEVDRANIESTTSMYEDKMGDIMEKFDKKIQIAELKDKPRRVQRLKNRQLRKLEKQSDRAEVDAAKTEKENILANWDTKIEDLKFEKDDYIQELKDGGATRQQIRQAKKDYRRKIKDAKSQRKWDKKEANKMVRENRRDARKSTTWTEDML